jgi:alpha-tubulin suppressor-like RCC1 family protein
MLGTTAIGNGGNTAVPVPVEATNVVGHVRYVDAKNGASVLITVSNNVYTWGTATAGRLLDGQTSGTKWIPTLVQDFGSVINGLAKKVAVGSNHMVGITQSGSAYSWGKGTDGQLCTGVNVGSQTFPASITGTFIDVAAGEASSVLLSR